jgi:hypothetical protein
MTMNCNSHRRQFIGDPTGEAGKCDTSATTSGITLLYIKMTRSNAKEVLVVLVMMESTHEIKSGKYRTFI